MKGVFDKKKKKKATKPHQENIQNLKSGFLIY